MVIIRQREGFSLLAKVISAYIGAVIGAGFASGQEIMQFYTARQLRADGSGFSDDPFRLPGRAGNVLVHKYAFQQLQEGVRISVGKQGRAFYGYVEPLYAAGRVGSNDGGQRRGVQRTFCLAGPDWDLVSGDFDVTGAHGRAGRCLNRQCLSCSLEIPGGCGDISSCAFRLSGRPGGNTQPQRRQEGITGNWALAGFLYVSYNMVVPVAVLSSLGRTVPLKTGLAGGLLGGLLLGLAIFLVTAAGLAHQPDAATYQIPMLYLAGSFGDVLRLGLSLLIWLAILTTAIANAHGFASRLASAGGTRYRLYGIVACLLALPLAGFSFTSLVRFLYPLFGYAGLILMIALLVRPLLCFFRNR